MPPDVLFEQMPADVSRGAADEDLRPVDRLKRLKNLEQTQTSLAADHRDLDHPAVCENLIFGNDRRFGKIDELDRVAGLVQKLVAPERDAFEMPPELVEKLFVLRREQAVFGKAPARSGGRFRVVISRRPGSFPVDYGPAEILISLFISPLVPAF
ncbi:MAG: hypothetical protein JSS81_11275 [Acidobacteria bacterium]|nr:hypothetical protein [Acidobacteriota bacterium]